MLNIHHMYCTEFTSKSKAAVIWFSNNCVQFQLNYVIGVMYILLFYHHMIHDLNLMMWTSSVCRCLT